MSQEPNLTPAPTTTTTTPEAWWLPTGSVRALLAVLLVGGVITAAFVHVPTEYFTALVGMASGSVGYYFGVSGKSTREGP